MVASFNEHVIFFLLYPKNPARKLTNIIQGRSSTLQAADIDVICDGSIPVRLQVSYGVQLDSIIIRGKRAQLVCVSISSCEDVLEDLPLIPDASFVHRTVFVIRPWCMG
jgi:hypothetical protein